MERDEQIEVLANAEKRAKDRVAAWIADPRLKTSLRQSYEKIQDMKNSKAPKRA